MKKYLILETFKGSQTGAITEEFTKDTERMISDDLAGEVKQFIKSKNTLSIKPTSKKKPKK